MLQTIPDGVDIVKLGTLDKEDGLEAKPLVRGVEKEGGKEGEEGGRGGSGAVCGD